ncbi:MAG: enoyl-CoA hydratase/isomerase family protein [Alphaproteobacteria bacterium]|nr:enoyl-CoA hydratase/isomerase family protein [Alphaproteobacteria bacterium]
MAGDVLLQTVRDGVATVSFNRPKALNAIDNALGLALKDTLHGLAEDKKVRCIVLRGEGDHFMAGGDINVFHSMLEQGEWARRRVTGELAICVHESIKTIRGTGKPVVASLRGAAAGFGMSLLLACDLAIASEKSFFTLAYRQIGLSPDGGSTYFLPRALPLKQAMEVALLGGRFDAKRAYELGIVNRVVADEKLEEATAEMAMQLATGPTEALARTKALLNHSYAYAATLESQLQMEERGIMDSAASEEFVEGINAFVAKRKPNFPAA